MLAMRRDLDLIRYILITAEAADGPVSEDVLVNDRHDIRSVAFHTELLADRGLIVATVGYDGLGNIPLSVEVSRITWDGYDYLDAIRSDNVWRKAKEVISSAVGDTSLSVVKETCQLVAKSLIMRKLGM